MGTRTKGRAGHRRLTAGASFAKLPPGMSGTSRLFRFSDDARPPRRDADVRRALSVVAPPPPTPDAHVMSRLIDETTRLRRVLYAGLALISFELLLVIALLLRR